MPHIGHIYEWRRQAHGRVPRRSPSVRDLERRAVLRPGAAVIVDPRCRDVGVAEPFLHLGDVRLVIERVDGGGRAQTLARSLAGIRRGC
jgi:hypothetical protein